MEEILKKLFESQVLNDETKKAITEAMKATMAEARSQQEKEIRAELSARYTEDKKQIHAAMGLFLEQEMNSHVAELREGIEEVNTLKSQYAEAIVNVKKQAKAYVGTRLKAMEGVIDRIIRKEITELHDSEKTRRRAWMNAINENESKFQTDREQFKKKAAGVLEDIINVQIRSMLEELRDDIQASKEIDFSREMFESFATTFRRQFFNSNKEFRNLSEKVKSLSERIRKTKAAAEKAVKIAESRVKAAERARAKLEEGIVRSRKITSLLSNIRGDGRAKMKTLLEATRTDNLDKTFKKFLPDVLNESKPTKSPARKLEETAVELKTGTVQGKTQINEDAGDDDEIVELRRRAGMTK